MKEYRILRGEDAANEDKINELAQQGFTISAIVTGSERHGMVLYMERDVSDVGELAMLVDEENNLKQVIVRPL